MGGISQMHGRLGVEMGIHAETRTSGKVEQTGAFYAYSASGPRYMVFEHTHFVDARTAGEGKQWRPIMKQYRTTSGYRVSRISDIVFEIAVTGERITVES